MTRFGTILVATDGSDDSDAAVEAALDLAHDTSGRLLVLSVVPEASGDGAEEGDGSDPDAEPPARDEDEEVIEANDLTNDVVDHAVEWGLEATPLVWEGEPADAILAAAESHGADVIVIGSSGKLKFENGGWVDNIPDMGELRLKVRGINNTDFRKMAAKLHEAEPRQFKVGGKMDPGRQDAITAKCLLHTVLLDWDGVLDDKGAPVPYSIDMARDLLTKPEFRRFREAVAWAANVVADDIAADTEEAGKNSPPPSSGN